MLDARAHLGRRMDALMPGTDAHPHQGHWTAAFHAAPASPHGDAGRKHPCAARLTVQEEEAGVLRA